MTGLTLKTVIRCMNYERSRRFYVDVLGLPVAVEWDEPGGRGGIVVLGQNAEIEIHQMTARDPRDRAAFHLPTGDDKLELQLVAASLDEWVQRLDQLWPSDGPTTMPWGERRLLLRDPDSVLVCICERRPFTA